MAIYTIGSFNVYIHLVKTIQFSAQRRASICVHLSVNKLRSCTARSELENVDNVLHA